MLTRQSIMRIYRSARALVRPAGCTLAALVVAAACSSSDDKSGEKTGQAVAANLAGSTFEGSDGNLIVNTPGNTDWVNAPNRVIGTDPIKGSPDPDNSFGQGTDEDDPAVTVVTGSIPPNKSDLIRFYEANEFAGGDVFLYLAWERTETLGSANMDFEINQQVTPGLGLPGPHTINRIAGDILITFDFTNGGGNPVLGLLTWVTTGATSQCFSSNSLPCWGNRVNLSAAGFAEGAINTGTVTDPIPPGLPRSLAENTFGEAAINLTDAGVFPPGTCRAFGSVFLKSRSSAAFNAEIKDFVAPVPVNISNCGTIVIHKVTENGDASFGYTTTGGLSPATFNLSNGGTRRYENVQSGSYTVTESTIPGNWMFKSLSCTASGSGTSVSTSGETATITVAPDGLVDCVYTNEQRLGAIKVTKTRKHAAEGSGDHFHSGVSFTVNGVTKQTDVNGEACFDELGFGTYTVHESVPAGYRVDANDKQVTVDNNARCSEVPYVGETVSFRNTPLTNLTVSVDSQVNGGTSSTITCGMNTASTGPNGDGSLTLSDLEPGTYTCTVVIDP